MEQIDRLINRLLAQIKNNPDTRTFTNDYKCPKCKDTYFISVKTGDPIYSEQDIPCECRQRKILQNRFKMSGLTEIMKDKTFDNFTPRPLQKKMYETAKEYAENYFNIKNNRSNGMALIGQVGNGKTHMMAAVANYLINKGVSVLFVYTPELIEELRQAQFTSDEELNNRINLVKNTEVVIFDDIAREKITEFARVQYDRIINHRYINGLPTLITSNLGFEGLEEKIGLAATDRLMAMTKDRIVLCTDNSYRMVE